MSETDHQSSNGIVLIVDDTPTNLEVLQEVLVNANYEVLVAIDGEGAIEQVKYAKPDIILLDVMMPGIDGFETCRRLKENPETSWTPVIFMTALAETPDKVKGFDVGGVDYITKPFQHSEVLARVRTQIMLSSLQRDLEVQVRQRTMELQKLNASYRKFVPQEFLKFLNKSHITEIELGDHVAMEMTVFFSDIHGWTTLSEKFDPIQNFQFVVDYFSLVGPLIREYSGFIDQYYGDGIMALFHQSPDDALNAAIRVVKKVQEVNTAKAIDDPPIRVGIGLHTGDLMLGIVGEEERMQGAVVSDNVNLASRIEGLTRVYDSSIVISEVTHQKLINPKNFKIRFLDSVKVKGRVSKVKLYEVYDGDSHDIISKKSDSREDFEKGILNYYKKQFAEASVSFNTVLETNPQDKAARIYLQRSAKYMVEGVPSDWDGAENVYLK